jgi:hypothetical protein
VVDLNMAYYFAIVPARSPEIAQAELNTFLRGHRVLTVDRRWVELGENSYWAICVDYLEPGGAGAGPQPKNGARGKIDYRERLSPEDFAVFARLRQLRKEIAQAAAVPVYMDESAPGKKETPKDRLGGNGKPFFRYAGSRQLDLPRRHSHS